jgi:hypothetical protein
MVEDGEEDSTPVEHGHGMQWWLGKSASAEEMEGWRLKLRREWLSTRRRSAVVFGQWVPEVERGESAMGVSHRERER